MLFDGEEIKLLIAKDLDFSDGEDEYIFGCWVGFSPIPRVSHKGSGERGTVQTWWVKQFFDIFVKKGDTWHVIMGDNHCFVLRDLVLIEFFQISNKS